MRTCRREIVEMNGGHEFFSSLFGEFLVGRDCPSVMQDPNADPMDREVCSSLLQFQDIFRDHGLDRPEHERADLYRSPPPQDPQSLRDEILKRPQSSQPRARKQPDEDLDGKWSMQWGENESTLAPPKLPHQQPGQTESYSSSTTVTVKRRPDGTYEEKRITKDSTGKEEVTTRVMEKYNHSDIPFYKRIFGYGPKNS